MVCRLGVIWSGLMIWSGMMRSGVMRSGVNRSGMMRSMVRSWMVGVMMRCVGVMGVFLLNMNKRVVIRVQIKFIERSLSFTIHVVPMVTLKSLLVEKGTIRA